MMPAQKVACTMLVIMISFGAFSTRYAIIQAIACYRRGSGDDNKNLENALAHA